MPFPLKPGATEPPTPTVRNVSWWAEFSPPWRKYVGEREIDADRTRRMGPWNAKVRTSGNTPLQIAATSSTLTWNAPRFRMEKVPFPNPTWRSTNSDFTWFGVDPTNCRYYEAAATGPMWPWLPTPWRADHIASFDLTKDWKDQPNGITAIGLPVWPMVPSIEALDQGAGGVLHALAFVAAGYSNEPWVGSARGADPFVERIAGHPLRAGERLRFSPAALARLKAEAKTPHDFAIIYAGEHFGFILTDQTVRDLTVGHAMRLPKDRRLNITIKVSLLDLVALEAAD